MLTVIEIVMLTVKQTVILTIMLTIMLIVVQNADTDVDSDVDSHSLDFWIKGCHCMSLHRTRKSTTAQTQVLVTVFRVTSLGPEI